MNTIPYTCPVCCALLERKGAAYVCPAGHSFDIAREGYVNLLLGKSHSGDDKVSVAARHRFLEKGYYEPLRKKLHAIALALAPDTILDIGCGEGYYDAMLSEIAPLYGVDISKEAVRLASRTKGSYAVASAAHLPFPDHTFSLIVSVFAPLYPKEAKRVLIRNGLLLKVTPAKDHLLELKQALYEEVDLNIKKPLPFPVVKEEELRFRFPLAGSDISSLIAMTPYAYKTSKDAIQRVERLDALLVTASFTITLYKTE